MTEINTAPKGKITQQERDNWTAGLRGTEFKRCWGTTIHVETSGTYNCALGVLMEQVGRQRYSNILSTHNDVAQRVVDMNDKLDEAKTTLSLSFTPYANLSWTTISAVVEPDRYVYTWDEVADLIEQSFEVGQPVVEHTNMPVSMSDVVPWMGEDVDVQAVEDYANEAALVLSS